MQRVSRRKAIASWPVRVRRGLGHAFTVLLSVAAFASAEGARAVDARFLQAQAEARRMAVEGRLQEAIGAWDALLRRSPLPMFTVLVGEACSPAEVTAAMEARRTLAPLWVGGGNPCHVLAWGAFGSAGDAAEAARLLPLELAGRSPRVVELRSPLSTLAGETTAPAAPRETQVARREPEARLEAPPPAPAEAAPPPAEVTPSVPPPPPVTEPPSPATRTPEPAPAERPATPPPPPLAKREPESPAVVMTPPETPREEPPAPKPPPVETPAAAATPVPATPATPPEDDSEPQTAASLFAEGNEAYTRGDFEVAVKAFSESIALEPDNQRTHNNLGTALLRSNQSLKAEEAFREALRLDPTYVRAALNLSTALYDQKRYADAEQALRHVLEMDPTNVDAHRNLGALYIELLRWQDAADVLEEGLRINADSPGLEKLLSQVQAQIRAREEVETATPSAPPAGTPQRPAKEDTRAGREVRPDSPCRDDLSHAGRVRLAARYFDEGRRARARDDLTGAEDAFAKALDCDPTSGPTANHLGAVRLLLGQNESALRAFDLALSLEPGSLDAGVNRAFALVELGRCGDAKQQLAGLVGGAEAERAFVRGQVLLKCGEVTEATAALERAVELDPGDQRARRLLDRIRGDQVRVP